MSSKAAEMTPTSGSEEACPSGSKKQRSKCVCAGSGVNDQD